MTNAIILKILEVGILPIAMLILGWLVGQYVKPWVHSKPSRFYKAKEIALLADRLTDQLCFAFPKATWDDILDQTVDVLIDKLDISRETATREVIHQLTKKMDSVVDYPPSP